MIVFIYIFAIIGVFWTLVICFDKIVMFNIWQSRIHIGRWRDIGEWQKALEKKCRKWLLKSPVVPKNDDDKLILIERLKKKYVSSTIQSWQIAGLLMGLNSVNITIKSSEVKKIVKKFEHVKDPDRALLTYSLMKIRCDNNKESDYYVSEFVNGTIQILEAHQNDGMTISYRKHCGHIKFVDTIGLVCPFLTLYGVKSGNLRYIDTAKKQIEEYKAFFRNEISLPPHAYNTLNNMPLGVYDWERGLGWYIIGIIESKRCLDNTPYESCDLYKLLIPLILELADRILKLQGPTGGFSSFLGNDNRSVEGSATILCGLLFMSAYEISKENKYKIAAERTIKSLMKITQRDGSLDMCQGDTKGIGVYSSQYRRMPFAQGLCLLLSQRFNEDA